VIKNQLYTAYAYIQVLSSSDIHKSLPELPSHSSSIHTGEHMSTCFKSSCLSVNELITPMSHIDLISPGSVRHRISGSCI
jgi:hypothetical protein